MALGIGSFAYSVVQTLKENGADVCTYLTRDYGHFPPSLAGPTFLRESHPSPVPVLKERGVKLIVPQSIDWAQQPWAADLLKSGVGILSPTGEAMRIERERDTFFESVRSAYLARAAAAPGRVRVIDASSSMEDVAARAVALLQHHMASLD